MLSSELGLSWLEDVSRHHCIVHLIGRFERVRWTERWEYLPSKRATVVLGHSAGEFEMWASGLLESLPGLSIRICVAVMPHQMWRGCQRWSHVRVWVTLCGVRGAHLCRWAACGEVLWHPERSGLRCPSGPFFLCLAQGGLPSPCLPASAISVSVHT